MLMVGVPIKSPVLSNASKQIVQVILKLLVFQAETTNSYLTNDYGIKICSVKCHVKSLLWLFIRMKVCFVLLKGIPLGKEEVTLVAKQPLLGDDISVLMVGVPVKVSGLVERFQTNCASNSHDAFIRSKFNKFLLDNC